VAYRFAADVVVLLHLGFIVFVVAGGLLLFRWPKVICAHVPVVLWGVAISVFQYACPLTPAENWLRRRGGEAGYEGAFIDRYLVPVIYPEGLTPEMGPWIGAAVAAVNLSAWGWVLWHRSDR
jgi:hypothetical protein